MAVHAAHLFVITGGPGSGKTTLIDTLARAGFARTVEPGRAIIQDQQAIDGPVPRAPAHVRQAATQFRYNRRVFIAPPCAEIYEPDAERKQSFAEAVWTCDAMVATYEALGHGLIELPRCSIAAGRVLEDQGPRLTVNLEPA